MSLDSIERSIGRLSPCSPGNYVEVPCRRPLSTYTLNPPEFRGSDTLVICGENSFGFECEPSFQCRNVQVAGAEMEDTVFSAGPEAGDFKCDNSPDDKFCGAAQKYRRIEGPRPFVSRMWCRAEIRREGE